MYIRLIDSTLRERENEYLFRLNDQQKVYFPFFTRDCSFLRGANIREMGGDASCVRCISSIT